MFSPSSIRRPVCALVAAICLAACNGPATASTPDGARHPRGPTSQPRSSHSEQPRPVAASGEDPRPGLPTRFPAAPVVVAIGDVHGDLAATRAALRLAGAIDGDERWTGGSLVVVQTGDQLDRGDDEQAILDLLVRLSEEASAAGGALHVLNGNHEFMNTAGDLRYVTPGGFDDFEDVQGLDVGDPRLASVPADRRARAAAFAPGGPYARVFAERNTVVMVGDTVFVHGGVLPSHVPRGVPDLERLNADARRWFAGTADASAIADSILDGDSGVVWTRLYARDDDEVCKTLHRTLTALGAVRMVVGHTVQDAGITSGCDGRVWRIDVGMAAHYGGTPQVLRIAGDAVAVIKPPS